VVRYCSFGRGLWILKLFSCSLFVKLSTVICLRSVFCTMQYVSFCDDDDDDDTVIIEHMHNDV